MRSIVGLVFALGVWCFSGLLEPTSADEKKPAAKEEPQKSSLDRFLEKFDKNNNGLIEPDEGPEPFKKNFKRLDTNNDGKLSREELKRIEDRLSQFTDVGKGPKGSRPAGRPGEIITPAAKGERLPDKLKVGDPAPDFSLPDSTGKKEIRLSSFKGTRPVVLIFASYT